MIYLFGSLNNPAIPDITNELRDHGHQVFSEWHAAGPDGDKWWKEYFGKLGYGYRETLAMPFVETAFNFDLEHMKKASIGVLVMPAGRSGHLELGWMLGSGKRGYILYPDGPPDRPDLMVKLATGICFSLDELLVELEKPVQPVFIAIPAGYHYYKQCPSGFIGCQRCWAGDK